MKWNFKHFSERLSRNAHRVDVADGIVSKLCTPVVFVVAVLAAALSGPAVFAAGGQPGATTFVERVEKLEVYVERGERRSRQLHAELTATAQALRGDSTSEKTAERARRRVGRKVAGQLVAWERAGRELRRATRYRRPGVAADTQTLLDRAETKAVGARIEDIDVLKTIETDTRRTRALVAEQAELSVELAQSEADTEAAEASREEVVREASRPENRQKVDRELEQTDQALDNSLGMLLKNDTARDFHRRKGTLLPPVSRPISFGYGPRKQRTSSSYVRHTGLTWKIEQETPVKSVAGGLVVFAGRFEGFGKVVIIDHGQDYHSLYAHLGTLKVEVGKNLEPGGLIGTSGQSGSFEGPKLYFELRKDGQPLDPSPWFIQR